MRLPAWWFPAALLLAASATAPGLARASADVASLPAPVREYVAGWLAHDGDRVDKVVDEDGGYRDPGQLAALSGPDLADYVASFRGARLELLAAKTIDGDHLDVSWRLTWPDARGAQTYVDHLTLAPDRIRIVISEGPAIPAALWPLIDAYFDHRGRGEAEKTAALFGADGVLEARNLPRGGIRGERLRRYFEADAHQKFGKRPGGLRQMTKDGRAAVDFELRSSTASSMVTGREVFTLGEKHIQRVNGLF